MYEVSSSSVCVSDEFYLFDKKKLAGTLPVGTGAQKDFIICRSVGKLLYQQYLIVLLLTVFEAKPSTKHR